MHPLLFFLFALSTAADVSYEFASAGDSTTFDLGRKTLNVIRMFDVDKGRAPEYFVTCLTTVETPFGLPGCGRWAKQDGFVPSGVQSTYSLTNGKLTLNAVNSFDEGYYFGFSSLSSFNALRSSEKSLVEMLAIPELAAKYLIVM